MADAVVIGAGLGGLAAAIRLAAAGVATTVLEAGPRPGGKADVVVIDGVEVDTGPSVLTMPDVLDELFEVSGARRADHVDLIQPEPAFHYHYPDGLSLVVHHELAATLDEIERALGSAARAEFASFMAYSRGIWEVAQPWFVKGPPPSFGTLASPRALWALTKIQGHTTFGAAIAARVSHPALRDLLARYATYNGSDPRVAPATLACIAWVELGLGGYGVRGGVHALVRALVARATHLGVRFQLGCPVARVVVERGRAVGVVTAAGEHVAARAVVCNADAAHLAGDLLAQRPRSLRRDAVPSMSGWVAVLKARRDAGRAPHAVWFPGRYADEFADVFDHDRPPVDPTVYVCAPEKAHARLGWAEHEPLFVMANAPAEPLVGPRSDETWRALRAAVLGRLARAGVEGEVVWERTPTGLASRFPGTRGAIYGASSNAPTAAFQRPPNALADVPGLFLASGSAHPGGGMPLCLLSGKQAAVAALSALGER